MLDLMLFVIANYHTGYSYGRTMYVHLIIGFNRQPYCNLLLSLALYGILKKPLGKGGFS